MVMKATFADGFVSLEDPVITEANELVFPIGNGVVVDKLFDVYGNEFSMAGYSSIYCIIEIVRKTGTGLTQTVYRQTMSGIFQKDVAGNYTFSPGASTGTDMFVPVIEDLHQYETTFEPDSPDGDVYYGTSLMDEPHEGFIKILPYRMNEE